MAAMLSPTSLAGLSINTDWARPIRAVSPTQGQSQGGSQGAAQLSAPLTPLPMTLPNGGGQPDGGSSSRPMPRGSLLDLQV
jgi:hypothetical protein